MCYSIFIVKKTHNERREMKQILEQWSGKFEVDGEIDINLDRLNVKDGEEFHVTLFPKNREVEDEDNMSAYRL